MSRRDARAMRAPLRGLRVQAVIDVGRTNRRRQGEPAQRGEQHRGVEPAAERNRHARRRLRPGPAARALRAERP